LNSGIAAYYYLRLLTTAYTRRSEESAKLVVAPVSFALAIALLLTAGATLVLGILPGRVLGSARAAAQTYAVGATVTAHQGNDVAPLEAQP